LKGKHEKSQKRRFQHKAFFWSLGHKTTIQLKSESSGFLNVDVYDVKAEN